MAARLTAVHSREAHGLNHNRRQDADATQVRVC